MTTKNRTTLTMAMAVLTLNVGVVLLMGCSRPTYKPKAWVSVEKPPMRVIYMDFEKDITPAMVHQLTYQVSQVPYRNYKFNDTASINVGFDATANSSHSDSTTINVGKN